MRVLIVEDQRELGEVFCDFVLELGHRPVLVPNAERALSMLDSERPDAIILDIRLPGMSGLDFLQADPVRESAIPIVAVSGVATEHQARECLQLGAVDFLRKPVPLERLAAALWVLELQALTPRAGRRTVVRAPITIAVQLAGEWEGNAIDLSPFGMKVRPEVSLSVGATIQISFTLPDGGPPLQVEAAIIRADPDGYTFSFLNVTDAVFRRLKGSTERLITREGAGGDPR